MKVHIDSGDGGAKCGLNVGYDHYPNGYNSEKVVPPVRKIYKNQFIWFANEKTPCNCKRCLNQINRPVTVTPTEDLTGKVFHYSFGYNMTINVFAKVIKKTAKGYICQELKGLCVKGSYDSGSVRASNEFSEDSKPFLMTKKRNDKYNYEYWTGKNHHWTLVEQDQTFYENHWD